MGEHDETKDQNPGAGPEAGARFAVTHEADDTEGQKRFLRAIPEGDEDKPGPNDTEGQGFPIPATPEADEDKPGPDDGLRRI